MRKRKKHKGSGETNLGFQIAPMIDVVFVIMLYFMVMAGAVQKEKSHNTKLPGTIPPDTEQETPDEISIKVEDGGQVYLNDEPLDSSTGRPLTELKNSLVRLKTSSDEMKAKVLVTIYADETAEYQRVMDVLDALGEAEIPNVTFQAGSAE